VAREGGGGGGAFGWTLVGIIVGIAGTLAVQTLLNTHRAHEPTEQPATSASVAIVTPPEAAPKLIVPPAPANVAVAAPRGEANTPSQEDVEDDATAAGMTSRTHPSDGQTAPAASN
jgi:hypothetical protein